MDVAVLGGGESGIGAALLAVKNNYDVFLSDIGSIDEKRKLELRDYKVDFEEGQHSFDKLKNADVVIKSPGIPGQLELIVQLRALGIEVISEIEWAFRHTDASIAAITGSNGKTTTTKLLHHMAQNAGLDAVCVGNIGFSASRQLAIREPRWMILEVSSFQLDDIRRFKPEIAIILNISPDHLDRYDDFMDYARAKWRICENQTSEDHLIFVAEKIFERLCHERPPRSEVVSINPENCTPGKANWAGSIILYDNKHLLGPHNACNVECAAEAARLMGIQRVDVKRSLDDFVNDPHRMEEVAFWNDIRIINDSKATNVEAAIKALESFDAPIIWIAGGTDKGNDYTDLLPLAREKVMALVAMGADNSKLLKTFANEIETVADCHSVEEAVKVAFRLAEKGTTILLSPACASFDLFNNYEERGLLFKQEILKYITPIG
ncbi:MAG: UDP-N-acetylmuramoyl-L-alanine--D-glutamate ligase [Saprospiraceae bacterium]|nr:UDP-N-acetylmuramoyl-L-alanine--D-glutamate ligase [Saprospiraceae bacterium]